MSLPAKRRPRDFGEDVSGAGNSAFWEEAHRAFFPEVLDTETTDDGTKNEFQALGIDRLILCPNNRVYYVEEKEREVEREDFLLEVWSNEAARYPGWIQKDLACDYVAYAFRHTGKVYYLPWLLLSRAWKLNGEAWLDKGQFKEDGFGLHRSRTGARGGSGGNSGYTTLNVSVPIPTLFVALCKAAVVTGTRI